MKRPKLKRDWIGLTVRTKREVRTNGGSIFPAGTVMLVTRNYRGLHLTYEDACENCRLRHVHRITGVSEGSVDIVDPTQRGAPDGE